MKKCLVCKIDSDDLLSHCKTEWHTYNLRRETFGLNVLSLEDFKTKQNELILKNKVEIQKDYFCCNKVFKSSKTYENHLNSKKHLQNSTNSIDTVDEDEIIEYTSGSDLEETAIIPLTIIDCLFCKSSSKTIERNLNHMTNEHHFNLPYLDYISDLEGLIEYLVCLIDEYHVCLQCNKQFDDRQAVRNHMSHMNHMQLFFNLESNGDDLSDYYSNLPKQVSDMNKLSDSMGIEAVLPNGKKIGNRKMNIYFNQNLTAVSSGDRLAIMSGPEKARMSLIAAGKYGQVADKSLLTPKEKKYKTLEARYIQLRKSRFSNFQQHFRAQILM